MALPWLVPALSIGGTLLSGWLGGRAAKKQASQPPQVDLVDTMHPVQEALLHQMGEYFQNTISQPSSASTGLAEEFYQKSVHDPAMRSWEREIAPQIEQQYVGPGTYWGSERAKGMERAANDLAHNLASVRAQTMFNARDADRTHDLNRIGQALGIMNVPTGVAIQRPQQPTSGQIISSQIPAIIQALLMYNNSRVPMG